MSLQNVAGHNFIIISTSTSALLYRFTRFYNTFKYCSNNFAMMYSRDLYVNHECEINKLLFLFVIVKG